VLWCNDQLHGAETKIRTDDAQIRHTHQKTSVDHECGRAGVIQVVARDQHSRKHVCFTGIFYRVFENAK